MFDILFLYTSVGLAYGCFDLTTEDKLKAREEFINYNVIKYDANEESSENFFDVNLDKVTDLISIRAEEASVQVIDSLKEKIKLNTGIDTDELFFKLEDDKGWWYYPDQTDIHDLTRILLKETNIFYYNEKFYFYDNECFDSWGKDELVKHVKMILCKLESFESID